MTTVLSSRTSIASPRSVNGHSYHTSTLSLGSQGPTGDDDGQIFSTNSDIVTLKPANTEDLTITGSRNLLNSQKQSNE